MRKNLMMILILFSLLLMTKNVYAKEVAGYGECSYNVISETEGTYKKYVDNNIRNYDDYDFTFGFSEIMGTEGNAKTLYVGTNKDGPWYDLYARSTGNLFAAKNFSTKGTQLTNNFFDELHKNNLECPKFFIMKGAAGKDTAGFYAKSENANNVTLVAELKNQNIIKMHVNEFWWYADISKNNSKGYDRIYIRIDENGVLKSKLRNVDETFTREIKVTGGCYYAVNDAKSLTNLKGLLSNNLIPKLYQGKNGIGWWFDERTSLCYPSSPSDAGFPAVEIENLKFSKEYICKTADDANRALGTYKHDLDLKRNAIYSTDNKSKLNKLFMFDSSNNRITGHVNYELDDEAALSSKLQLIEEESKLVNSYLSSIEYYTKILNDTTSDSELCESAKEVLYTYHPQSVIEGYNDEAEHFLNNLKSANVEISKIAEKKGFTSVVEKTGEIGGTLDDYSDRFERVSHSLKEGYVSLLDADSAMFDFGGGYKTGCEAIAELTGLLQTILNYIRIIGIALAVIFQVLDYIKVIFGSADDSMVKANKHLSIRIIAVALLFLAPAIITFVLQFFNLNGTGAAGTCNIN